MGVHELLMFNAASFHPCLGNGDDCGCAGQPEGVSNVGESSGADKGRGPRIYVGGIPTAVSETMVRNHFSQWGQVGCPLTCLRTVCLQICSVNSY